MTKKEINLYEKKKKLFAINQQTGENAASLKHSFCKKKKVIKKHTDFIFKP